MPSGKSKRKTWVWVGAAVGLGIIWLRNWKNIPFSKLPSGARVELAMKPVKGQANQVASISTYRIIANRRQGLDYVPVTEESDDRTLVFTLPASGGTVTRNVVVEGNSKYVEVAPA